MITALPNPILRTILAATCAGLASPALLAQTHTRSDLVDGQRGEVRVQGATPGHLAWFAFGFQGPGSGLCVALPGPCLDFVGAPFVVPMGTVPASGVMSFPFVLPRGVVGVPVSSQAVTADPVRIAFRKSNALHGPIAGLDSLSDEFNGGSLSAAWRSLHPALTSARQSGGALRLRTLRGGPAVSWYADGEGPFLYKEVTGDFEVSARIRVARTGNPTQPPTLSFNLAGLLVRDPQAPAGDHDWVHLTVGAGDTRVPLAVEDKTTVDSRSDLRLYPIPGNQIEIRITRRGPTIACFWRTVGATTWTALRSFPRGDLPATVQVGIDIGWWPNSTPDMEAAIDWIRFRG